MLFEDVLKKGSLRNVELPINYLKEAGNVVEYDSNPDETISVIDNGEEVKYKSKKDSTIFIISVPDDIADYSLEMFQYLDRFISTNEDRDDLSLTKEDLEQLLQDKTVCKEIIKNLEPAITLMKFDKERLKKNRRYMTEVLKNISNVMEYCDDAFTLYPEEVNAKKEKVILNFWLSTERGGELIKLLGMTEDKEYLNNEKIKCKIFGVNPDDFDSLNKVLSYEEHVLWAKRLGISQPIDDLILKTSKLYEKIRKYMKDNNSEGDVINGFEAFKKATADKLSELLNNCKEYTLNNIITPETKQVIMSKMITVKSMADKFYYIADLKIILDATINKIIKNFDIKKIINDIVNNTSIEREFKEINDLMEESGVYKGRLIIASTLNPDANPETIGKIGLVSILADSIANNPNLAVDTVRKTLTNFDEIVANVCEEPSPKKNADTLSDKLESLQNMIDSFTGNYVFKNSFIQSVLSFLDPVDVLSLNYLDNDLGLELFDSCNTDIMKVQADDAVVRLLTGMRNNKYSQGLMLIKNSEIEKVSKELEEIHQSYIIFQPKIVDE